MEKSRRRKPAQERWIKELSNEDENKRVRILGAIIEANSDQNYAILDDGTGQVHIQVNESLPVNLGDQVRVFGIVRGLEQNIFSIEAEIIQDIKKLDMELFRRVQQVKRKFREKSN